VQVPRAAHFAVQDKGHLKTRLGARWADAQQQQMSSRLAAFGIMRMRK
jgi:hypothetical protein